MADPRPEDLSQDPREVALMHAMQGFVDPAWYLERYPDIARADLDPLLHFIRHGIAERRDPNRFFDTGWYAEHYPDVDASGIHPLLHYLQAGAAELRNPHPNFDAVWYASRYPDAAGNPLLYHIRIGLDRNHETERPFDIRDYLPAEHSAPPMVRDVVVDVIVPAYRGLEETQRCIASVLAAAEPPMGRVIVVDDCSPEPALSAWLRDQAAKGRIHLVRNSRNQGFVASVNRGMVEAGAHDVVLLNSDTEVPSGWLQRLTTQAHADPRVATVSPFSNNATICGYPDNDGGPIAFGQSVAELDRACQTANAGRWIDVPTTVGFCMYIRRQALEETGLFDADRFTLGYGEENDFCLRASALGWRHRLACDIFVYHKGSVSFGDKTSKLSARAIELLLERYPHYSTDIARHVSLGTVIPYRFAVTAALFRQSNRPVILMVTHDLGGGVQRHIADLVERYSCSAHILLLKGTARGAVLSVPALPNHPELAMPAARIEDLTLLLKSMRLTRVHIHHLMGMDMDIRSLIQRLTVPFDVTVHDYYAICPQINLLPWRESLYCREPGVAACNECIAQRSSHGARDIVTWRAEHAWLFQEADRVLCPSRDVVSRLQHHGLASRAVFAPHEPVAAAPWPLRIKPARTGKFRIAVLGNLADHKGSRTVASVAELIDTDTTEIHLIGHTDGYFAKSARRRMKITGPYQDAELPGLIKATAPHVIWFPAAWPETYSYTLSAAIKSGIPIAATRIGAHTERLAARPFTWLADNATSSQGWIAIFDQIHTRLRIQSSRTSQASEVHHPIKRSGSGRAGAVLTPLSSDSGWAADSLSVRPAIADFYATQYLKPRTSRRPTTPSKPRVAIVPECFAAGAPTPCAYIRLLQPLFHPAITQDFDVRLATADTISDHHADIIVTQRYAISAPRAADRLFEHAHRTRARLVYDLDDDLLNIPPSHPDAHQLRPLGKAVRRMLAAADAVWVSTPGLATRLSPIRPDAIVIENRLDERIWTHAPPPAGLHDHPVRILCMGTGTHDRDFALIEPALLRLKAEHGERIAVEVLGMTSRNELPPSLHRIGPPTHATRSYPGFVNWLTTRQPRWHIGLAPLLDTAFNGSKSSIKAMDYAALGLAVLASDTPVYRGSLADGPAGALVANDHRAWHAALDWLIRDQHLRQTTGVHARDAFLARATLAGSADTRRAALAGMLLTAPAAACGMASVR
jgi:GT2 family glycosyltransferase/glycosyltransferase involved in cell wall biosynthesis